MSFRTNDCQQISLNDKLMNLTEREKKALNKSWAKGFADEIFPAIDEERFSVLYSDKASRPDTPVNVIIGALIIKELSDKTLSRFRKRCYDHETLHGVDLYRDCVKDLSGKIAKIMKLNGRIRRMELIYTCISKLIVYLTKNASDKVSEQLKHYADSNDYNRIFYHQRNDDMENIIQMLLTDSDSLLEICKTDFEEVTEYQLFVRCLSEQTVVENEKRRLRTKEDGTMNSSALQNPSDPDATYRKKSGKLYRGYAANLEETVGKNGSVITDYQFDKNTHTDSHFLQDTLSAMEKSEEEIILITDGGYDGQDNIALAKEKNVKLVTTALARLRNGVETIPANIRKNYHLDKLPRGKQRGKFFFGSKIAALNFRKLFGFRKGLGNYAPNPVLV